MRIPLVLGVVLGSAAAPLFGGIDVIDQTARATGMAGAYVAQAGDPSAIYFNPGGLGLMSKKKGATAGVTVSSFRNFQMQGTAPGPAAGTTAQLKETRNAVPYLFLTLPLGARGVIGVGTYTPFRMRTEWRDPATFAGRDLATRSSIDTLDIAPTLGYQVTPSFGIGGGAIYRTTKLAIDRNVSTSFNGSDVDIATMSMKSDSKSAIGWNAGFLFRSSAFSVGGSYRSATKNDFTGAGTLTQITTGNAQLDQLVAASFPFGQNLGIATHLDLPAQANVGLAFGSQPLLFEVDVNRTSWKKTTAVNVDFPANPTFSIAYPLSFKDTTSYRAGVRFQLATGPVLRAGYAIDKTPQPNETVGPFLADADRNTITAGFGLDWLDVAVAWSRYGSRSIATNVNAFNGNYSGNAWSFAITATK